MEWIAHYWWLWLIGLSAALAAVAWRSITGLYGLAKDSWEIAARLHDAADGPAEDRRRRLTNVGLELARDKVKRQAKKFAVNGLLLLVGGGCGILLLLAAVQRWSR